jgi:predicted kinase
VTVTEPNLILIGGAPGVGKSTLADSLKKAFPKGITLESDLLWGCLNAVNWYNQDQAWISLKQTFYLAEKYLQSGFHPITVVNVFTTRTLERVFKLFEERKAIADYKIISIYMSDTHLEQQVLNRKDGGWKDLESCYFCNHDVQTQHFKNQTLINVESLEKESLVRRVTEIIKSH